MSERRLAISSFLLLTIFFLLCLSDDGLMLGNGKIGPGVGWVCTAALSKKARLMQALGYLPFF